MMRNRIGWTPYECARTVAIFNQLLDPLEKGDVERLVNDCPRHDKCIVIARVNLRMRLGLIKHGEYLIRDKRLVNRLHHIAGKTLYVNNFHCHLFIESKRNEELIVETISNNSSARNDRKDIPVAFEKISRTDRGLLANVDRDLFSLHVPLQPYKKRIGDIVFLDVIHDILLSLFANDMGVGHRLGWIHQIEG